MKSKLASGARQEIEKMFAQGNSYSLIARKFNVSRQRIQQLIKPPKEVYEFVKKLADSHCQRCGEYIESGHVHHLTRNGDFNKIDNLSYLCPGCHRTVHCPEIRSPRKMLPRGERVEVTITFRISRKEWSSLKRLSAITKMSQSKIVRMAIARLSRQHMNLE